MRAVYSITLFIQEFTVQQHIIYFSSKLEKAMETISNQSLSARKYPFWDQTSMIGRFLRLSNVLITWLQNYLFLYRLKYILYNSSTGAYFATFVPCWFAPASLHFDLAWVVRHGVLVWVGAFVLSTVMLVF